MRSRCDGIALEATLARAKTLQVCGFGGSLRPAPSDVDEAVALASEQHDIRLGRRIGRFADLADGFFVWTRDEDQLFWLGCVHGPWHYDDSADAAAVDLVHVRPCTWTDEPVLASEAPAAVLATFGRGGRNFQRIHDSRIAAQTVDSWHRSHHPRADQ
jgi:hypothetical protein